MTKTKEWAESLGLCCSDSVPPVEDDLEPCKRTADEVAIRAIILHCVAAVGYDVDPKPMIKWLKDESVWHFVTPVEQSLFSAVHLSDQERSDARWRKEALWALLWAIGKIDALGLPTRTCDTRMLIDHIMPALGDSIEAFVVSAKLRSPAELLGEDDRVYNLHCYARKAIREQTVPDDLIYDVLFQRHYALEWLGGDDNWDDVATDT